MSIDAIFAADITRDKKSGWTCVEWPDSVAALGTGMAVKVVAAIDDHEFEATFLPVGGMHMLPLRAAILKGIGRSVGDAVEVRVKYRL